MKPRGVPVQLRTWLRADPEAASVLLGKVTRSTIRYLVAQVEAGAKVSARTLARPSRGMDAVRHAKAQAASAMPGIER